ncbi:hypothetical protein NFHSH190041_09870 [Shewanella sp. NFH-SH190041]|uniref:nuclear transport factor 2 family protein n=1 Tax=Shewanella sp. NFH-SH190041 TaxID=2950245 RepID=UPI0021C30B41|nr:nuclear transport factor 2 family protein [Shewanella sp. NFH-SH190041]BDM63535.1 hypothetical protein NFHSH190041_09870 [Shewanella sp. NFH-SH190041]
MMTAPKNHDSCTESGRAEHCHSTRPFDVNEVSPEMDFARLIRRYAPLASQPTSMAGHGQANGAKASHVKDDTEVNWTGYRADTADIDGASMLAERFIQLYQVMDHEYLQQSDLALLQQVYHAKVVFTDPLHTIESRNALLQYLQGMYVNVIHLAFDIHQVIYQGEQICLQWHMQFAHKRLNSGKLITVPGMSWLGHNGNEFADEPSKWQITAHRDYFDVGALLYEHVPLLGGAIRTLKRRMAI